MPVIEQLRLRLENAKRIKPKEEEPRSTYQLKKRKKTAEAEEALPTSIKEKETHWLRRAVSPLHHQDGSKILVGIW
eukprot:1156261-Pelagomonas_calceolata.AAC.2